jgi:hypothetical protein
MPAEVTPQPEPSASTTQRMPPGLEQGVSSCTYLHFPLVGGYVKISFLDG